MCARIRPYCNRFDSGVRDETASSITSGDLEGMHDYLDPGIGPRISTTIVGSTIADVGHATVSEHGEVVDALPLQREQTARHS